MNDAVVVGTVDAAAVADAAVNGMSVMRLSLLSTKSMRVHCCRVL